MKKIILFLLISINSIAQTYESYRLKANTYFDQGKYKEAISALTMALKLNPKEFKNLKNRAICYEKLEKFDLALKDNLEVLKFERSGKTLGSVGYDFLWLEKYEQSREYLNEAIKLDPTNFIYRYNLALTYQYEDKFDKAINLYDEALKVSPRNSNCLISKTRCLIKLNQFEKATSIIDSFFIEKDFDVEMLILRGDIKQHNGKIEDALFDYSRAISIIPNDLRLLTRAANCLNDLEYFEEEISIRKRILDEMEKQGETKESKAINFGLLGFAQFKAFEWEEALHSFNMSLNYDNTENAANIYYYRTIVNAKLKKFEDACNDLKKAKELNPNEAENYENSFAEDEDFEDFYKYCFPNP